MLNISRIKGNQTTKFGQLIEYNKGSTLFKNHAENEAGKLVPRCFLFFKKALLGKSKWSAAWFHYISIALKLVYNKNKLLKTLHYWSRDVLNFDFLDKGLGIVFSPHFVYDFSIKMFLMLYSINWPNFIFWLSLLLEILGNLCVASVYQPGCDVINFKINLIFLIKPFLYMSKKSIQRLKYIENEKSF